jgi:phosphatidylglycerol:prolipoprotein diacylglycerol transferase
MDAAPLVPVAAGHWVHDLSPFIIPAWSSWLPIRWYGVAYLLGFVVGYWLLRRWSLAGRLPTTPKGVEDLAVGIALGVIVGGRLGYCVFYEPSLFIDVGGGLPWWGVLRVTDGGMSSHGGIIGMVVGWWWWCRKHQASWPVMADAVGAGAGFGILFGRLANFINGELWGRPSDVPWAIIFPAAPLVDGHQVARHPSQLYAAGLEGVLLLVVALVVHARHRRPGVTSGVVLITYSIGRFVGEFFREPDKGQPGGLGGGDFILGFMSKGQALTLPVMVIGLAILVWALRRPARPDLYILPVPDADRPQPAQPEKRS